MRACGASITTKAVVVLGSMQHQRKLGRMIQHTNLKHKQNHERRQRSVTLKNGSATHIRTGGGGSRQWFYSKSGWHIGYTWGSFAVRQGGSGPEAAVPARHVNTASATGLDRGQRYANTRGGNSACVYHISQQLAWEAPLPPTHTHANNSQGCSLMCEAPFN